MVCKVCGRTTNNEEANFCEYCGASFREMGTAQCENMNTAYNQQGMNDQNVYQNMNQQPMYGQQPMNGQQYYGQSMNGQQMNGQSMNGQPYMGPGMMNEPEKPVSFWQWVGIMLLPCIPIVGPLAYIVMLFIFAFGNEERNKTRKNWSRAMLLVMAISLVLVIILFGAIVGGITSSGINFNEYMNNAYHTY